MVVELSSVQVEDVENPHSGPTTASTTNSTFNYGRDILRIPADSGASLLAYRTPFTSKVKWPGYGVTSSPNFKSKHAWALVSVPSLFQRCTDK